MISTTELTNIDKIQDTPEIAYTATYKGYSVAVKLMKENMSERDYKLFQQEVILIA